MFCELRRQLSFGDRWQLYYWRDRTKEADFLFHKAGRFKIADAKWPEHPTSTGKLEKVRSEFPDQTEVVLFCRTSAVYSVTGNIQAVSMIDIKEFIEG